MSNVQQMSSAITSVQLSAMQAPSAQAGQQKVNGEICKSPADVSLLTSCGGNGVSSVIGVSNQSGTNGVITPPGGTLTSSVDRENVYKWINELSNADTRENALFELSKKREMVPDLATMLWYSFGSITALLHEIITVYPTINPPTLSAYQSNRVCNALALLQCIASHSETRSAFLAANIPSYLYPFLQTTNTSKTRPFEYLRLTSLGVIGALVKTDEQQVINFLLTTEIIPLCLRIMESGSELSKTVATFILQKILLDETGLCYICQTYERFSHVAIILGKMVIQLAKEPSARLLKHVIRCYLRLSDNPRAKEALRQCLPDQLKDPTFAPLLKDDKSTRGWLAQLLKNLEQQPMQQVVQ